MNNNHKTLTINIINDTILNIHLNIYINIKESNMDRNKIVSSVKRQEEEKIGFSLKMPISLKEQLQTLAESESISMNSLIVATLQSMIDDECGKQLRMARTLLLSTKKLVEESIDNINANGLDADNVAKFSELTKLKTQIEEF